MLVFHLGLITADEIVAAGSGAYNGNANSNYYLARSSNWYWSITPNGTNGRETGLFIVYYGSLGGWGVLGNGGVSVLLDMSMLRFLYSYHSL